MNETKYVVVSDEQHLMTLLSLSIAALSFLTYLPIFSYFFTASDSFTLIDTSRIRSLADVGRLFTQPLMTGSSFAQTARYYRPLSSLSYSIDYAIWGLAPFGYHLTNVTLHIIVSLLAFRIMLCLTHGRKAVSWLSAVIFTTHPILVETVPAIARRHDMIATAFLLASFAFFLNDLPSVPTRRRRRARIFSVLAYVCALGAKEIAILLPCLLCAYLMICVSDRSEDEHASLKIRAFQTITRCLPYFMVAAAYMIWRIHVLGGIGGRLKKQMAVGIPLLKWYFHITRSYFMDLLYPIPLNGVFRSLFSLAIFFGAVCAVIILLTMRKTILSNMRRLNGFNVGRMLTFLFIWLLLPLGLFGATRTFAHRNLYMAVIPFSAILAISIIEGMRHVVGKMMGQQKTRNSRRRLCAVGGVFIAAGGVALYLFSFSPLFRTYGEWEDSGKIAHIILEALSKTAAELPDHTTCTMRIYDLPSGIASYKKSVPRVKSASYLENYSITSYLKLTHPEKRFDVVIESKAILSTYPINIEFETIMKPGNNIIIAIKSSVVKSGINP